MARRSAFERQAAFEAALAKQPAAMREAIRLANNRTALAHAARLRRNVPKGSPNRGHIVSSVRVRAGSNDLEVIVSVGSPEFPYAAALEFGHKNRDGSQTAAVKYYFPLVKLMRRKHRAALIRAARKVWRGK